MTAKEFAPIGADIQARWFAFPIPKAAMAQYVLDLRELEAGDVAAAVAMLSDRDRPPTPAQIRRRVIEMQIAAPDWPTARADIARWRARVDERATAITAWVCPARLCDGKGFIIDDRDARDCECRPLRLAAMRGLDEMPALIAEFVGVDGQVTNAELDALLGGDTTLEAQVRWRWEAFCRRIVNSRVLAALPGSDLPAIEDARADVERREQRRGTLRPLGNVVALLERGE